LYAGPLPALAGIAVDDAQGNGNGRLDPGEDAAILVSLRNEGFHGNDGVDAAVVCSDPYIQVSTTMMTFAPFPALGVTAGAPAIAVTVDPDCPAGWAGSCSLVLEGAWMRPDTVVVPMTVGRPMVLVVDSDNEPTETRLMDALARAPIAVDTWYQPAAPVTLDLLRRYRAVIWTAGDQNTSSVPSADRQALSAYLDLGGALLLSAENYLSAYGSDPFTTGYLHVSDFTTGIDVNTVNGVAGDPVTGGMAMSISFPGALSDTPDAIVPDAQAAGILRVNGGATLTALRYPSSGSSAYRVIFTATPLEALVPGPTSLELMLGSMVEWLLQSSDTEPPAPVASLDTQAGGGAGQAILTWAPSFDDVGVAYYRVYESEFSTVHALPALLADVVTTTSTVRAIGLPDPGKAFWAVTAVDAGGNESAPSPMAGGLVFTLAP
jgi:hypothetical protein